MEEEEIINEEEVSEIVEKPVQPDKNPIKP